MGAFINVKAVKESIINNKDNFTRITIARTITQNLYKKHHGDKPIDSQIESDYDKKYSKILYELAKKDSKALENLEKNLVLKAKYMMVVNTKIVL